MTSLPPNDSVEPDSYVAGSTVSIYRRLEDHYETIFGDFSRGTFYGFNPHFPAEHAGPVAERAIEIHLQRLQSRLFKRSKYLFFLEESLRTAKAFFGALYDRSHDDHALRKVQVLLADLEDDRENAKGSDVDSALADSARRMTYFVGWCGLVPKCVLYLYDETESRPVSVLVYKDNPAMHRILSKHFESHWREDLAQTAVESLHAPIVSRHTPADGNEAPPSLPLSHTIAVTAESQTTRVQVEWLRSAVRVLKVGRQTVSEIHIESGCARIKELLRACDVAIPNAVEQRNACLLLAVYAIFVKMAEPTSRLSATEDACSNALEWFRALPEDARSSLVGGVGRFKDHELRAITAINLKANANKAFQKNGLDVFRGRLR